MDAHVPECLRFRKIAFMCRGHSEDPGTFRLNRLCRGVVERGYRI